MRRIFVITVSLLFIILALPGSHAQDPREDKIKAEHFLQERDFKKALKYIQAYLKAAPGDPVGHQIAARCHYEMGNYDKAKASAHRVIEISGEDLVSSYILGEIYLRKGDVDGSLEFFNKAISINREYPHAHSGAARCYLRKKEITRAKREFKIARDAMIIPDIPFYKLIAESFLSAGLPNEAIATYKELSNEYPENAEVYYLTGKAYQKKGDESQGEAFFKKAIERDPKNVKYHEALGDSYLKRSNGSEAMKEYEKAASLGKISYMTSYRLGLWYFKKSDYDRAAPHLVKALAEKKDIVNARMALSAIYLEKGKYKECIEECKSIVKLQPQNDTGYYNMACAYAMLDKKGPALQNLKKAIELVPQNKDIAKEEKCFSSIKNNKEFVELVKGDPPDRPSKK